LSQNTGELEIEIIASRPASVNQTANFKEKKIGQMMNRLASLCGKGLRVSHSINGGLVRKTSLTG
jgi:hypothetical protein